MNRDLRFTLKLINSLPNLDVNSCLRSSFIPVWTYLLVTQIAHKTNRRTCLVLYMGGEEDSQVRKRADEKEIDINSGSVKS